jgi:hypothetical protein
MRDTVKYEIGAEVYCAGSPTGKLVLVVVDPVARKLAHLVVAPHHGGESRLVPVSMAHPSGDGVHLDTTPGGLSRLEPAVKTHFMPAADPEKRWGYQHDEVVSWPFFGLGPGAQNLRMVAPEPVMLPRVDFEDRVPAGEVRIRRGEHVHATDGSIGHVRGLVVDQSDETVTHVLLDEGHLWGHKLVAIPMGVVGDIDDEHVEVRLTRHQVKDLPPVEVLGLD